MNIMALGSLSQMLGKSVTIDGCHIGYLKDLTLEQTSTGVTIKAEIAATDETLDKLAEYSEIMQILGQDSC